MEGVRDCGAVPQRQRSLLKPPRLRIFDAMARHERKTTMKLKVNWKALGKALWEAVKPVLLAAVGGGLVAVSSGCSSMTPSSKTQSMGVYALGIPGIAIITQSTQNEDASGGDTNVPTQANPVTVDTKIK